MAQPLKHPAVRRLYTVLTHPSNCSSEDIDSHPAFRRPWSRACSGEGLQTPPQQPGCLGSAVSPEPRRGSSRARSLGGVRGGAPTTQKSSTLSAFRMASIVDCHVAIGGGGKTPSPFTYAPSC